MKIATLAAMAVLTGLCARAEAYPVTYALTATVYNAAATDARGLKNGDPLPFQLTIDSAAVARGSFALQGFVDLSGSHVIGNIADFVSATTAFGEAVSPKTIYSTFATSLTFNKTGQVTAGIVDFGGTSSGQRLLSTGGNLFSGTFGGDGTRCGANICGVSGQLVTAGYQPTAVPEPSSLVVLAIGIAELASLSTKARQIRSPLLLLR